MAPVIRFGVIGTSWWADLTHLPMLKADPRVALNALCGRNRERADEMARKYGFERVNTDYRDMIDRGDLDAIVISAPDDQHYQMVMDALEAGLHVVCEKPLALNAADAKAMYEKAEQKGLRHMAFFTWRWMPQYRYARELVEDGAIGRLYHAAFRFSLGLGATRSTDGDSTAPAPTVSSATLARTCSTWHVTLPATLRASTRLSLCMRRTMMRMAAQWSRRTIPLRPLSSSPAAPTAWSTSAILPASTSHIRNNKWSSMAKQVRWSLSSACPAACACGTPRVTIHFKIWRYPQRISRALMLRSRF
jgi:hypothetical protein